MDTKQAISIRLQELLALYNTNANELANKSGLPRSTIYSILGNKSKHPEVVTIKKLCDGLEITLIDFFNCEIFKNLEQEIK